MLRKQNNNTYILNRKIFILKYKLLTPFVHTFLKYFIPLNISFLSRLRIILQFFRQNKYRKFHEVTSLNGIKFLTTFFMFV